ncbi:hypothetical protein B7P43_G08630 [Cryptotermes secundus]|uniref:Uncharacterized protein n=1 Tax=Cryptotermes secundus TaxID=105785 RepID=A0A2J7Q5Z5_9NEOP|nr:hypothetical protein B7P43_G08630 [Cryptotermes secundus]
MIPVTVQAMKLSYYYIFIAIEEKEYEEDSGFIRTLKEISTDDYLLLLKSSKFQMPNF